MVNNDAGSAGTLSLLGERSVWLTSFWGFDPATWGGLGFTRKADRDAFLKGARPGSLVAIYVTKAKGPKPMRGKVVGLLEITHSVAPMQELTSADEWERAQQDAKSQNKWAFGVAASRAWHIAPEDWRDVDELFVETYENNNAENIGARCVKVDPKEVPGLFELTVSETPVYRQARALTDLIGPVRDVILQPSRAIHPGVGERWIGEVDGPKHLYILRLRGNVSHFLGRPASAVTGLHVIKVGFSKSPHTRRRQIQSSYPSCAFEWEVLQPETVPEDAPFPNAAAAIVGEDAMKARLVQEGAESLGGEFFLADDDQIVRVWNAGRFARGGARYAA